MKNKGMIDSGTIIGGLVTILVIGVMISIMVGINSKIDTSITNSLSSSTIDQAARVVIGNSTASVNQSYGLASNIPILIIAVLMILILLSVATTLV